MTTSILVTKLYIPPTRPELVPRPRLIERMDGGLHSKLTLIAAPAGFDKTTLVTEWLDSLRLDSKNETQTEIKIAWLSLDEGDNDLTRFITYLIAALNRAAGIEATFGRGVVSMIQSHQPPATESILVPLVNEIAAIPVRIILVLDDYHVIHSAEVNDVLTFLLENQPPQVHLVIASREDPDLPLSRLRARGQLTELRAADLRFTSSEAADFLNQVMGLNLSPENVSALERRTEGWIAGLQLAAISLQGRDATTDLIKSFSGSHRIVLDYLVEEVLDQQSESVQTFLLQTSILDRFNGPLCDALTGQANGQQTLEYLDHANLFIVPLDNERRWYRYHHLFADLLQQRLNQIRPEQIPVLHQKASKWFKVHRYPDEAIVHALRAGDFNGAVALIDKEADALWQRGEHGKLRAWLQVTPVEFIISKPLLSIYHAYYLHSSGQHEEGNYLLGEAEKYLEASKNISNEASMINLDKLSKEQREQLLGRFELIRACDYCSGLLNCCRAAFKHAGRMANKKLRLRSISHTELHTPAHLYCLQCFLVDTDRASLYQDN